MSWILSIWASGALLALCSGQSAAEEGNNLYPSGYHLCIRNQSRNVSFLVIHPFPYTVTRPCGGWLLWTTCTVTLYKMMHQIEYKTVKEQVTRCCDGYEQVGRYCSLSVNRSDEFAAKPGSCPTADGPSPSSVDCEFDLDCPGWQKCCQRCGRFLCSDPTRAEQEVGFQGSFWNTTVTVKMDYQQLLSKENGLLNLTRLLQAMITGALDSEVSIFYLSSRPVHPYRVSTSLLIRSNSPLSLHSASSKLHLLLKHIPEVSSVTVRDVDECVHPALHRCSTQTHCSNTLGSYQCVSQQEYLDGDPDDPGVNCTGCTGVGTTAMPPVVNTTFSWTLISTRDPSGDGSVPLGTGGTAALTNTSPVTYNLSHASLGRSSAPATSMSQAAASALPAAPCRPPRISGLWSANVTGTSMSVQWSTQVQSNQTFWITLSKTSEVTERWETNRTMIELNGLQPGVLYNVTVTPCACGGQGSALHMMVKTDAQTLDATTRLTNIKFNQDLRNSSSQAYKNLTETFTQEIYKSLPPEIKAMVDSGQVRIEIQSFHLGSVVVDFSIIFNPSPGQAVGNVSSALVQSLMNSSRFTVDGNSTSINDFDECASGENDCSRWAICTNTWASYTCICLDGFIDNNPERPGRKCQANGTVDTISAPEVSTISPTPPVPTFAQATNSSKTTNPVLATSANDPPFRFAIPTATANNNNIPPTTATSATLYIAPVITSTTQTSNNSPTLVINVPTSHSAALTNTLRTTSIPMILSTNLITTAAPRTTTITDSEINTTHSTTSSSQVVSSVVPTTTTTPSITSTTPSSALRSATDSSLSGALSVHCRVAAITVTLAKAFLVSAKIPEGALYLGMPECGVNGGNASHVQMTVAWNECDTRLVHNETMYTASVKLFNGMDPYTAKSGAVEVPRIRLEVPIMCSYMTSMLISADFGSMGYNIIKDVITGLGSFQVAVQLMNGTAPLPHNYSLSPGQAVVMEASLNSTLDQMKVVINKCWTTPTQNPADPNSYTFLENSCPLNVFTKVLMNGNSTTSRVSVQIFSFVNLNVIYLHCKVQICVQVGSNTCVPDCFQRTARTENTIGTSVGSSGPILRLTEESLEEKLNTIHIVGLSCLGVGVCLCFIVGFVCLFYCQRNRIGHYNFNVKPKEENFTYLVFNT
ncbi:uromodulin-like 1 [Xiphophorus hellerii]|uniref:uromodulin-like 1 n=1 Tax=Xiphophorus hellerii TaxID=8084 RepID=UPI0013B41559|nr:uromodulin-like 1 [Xiphophorus hellerii]XP_032433098.1 uromodulin-like 1 [Xiphophorus hellerii]XP_032433099.1 uromodulin-like 1 [Xiphophorus hellerii]